jgi:hypothetical protein
MKKRDRASFESDYDASSDSQNRFFDAFVDAVIDNKGPVQNLITLCQRYGRLHGEALRKKVEDSSAYSKRYQSSSRKSKSIEAVSNESDTTSSNFQHPFFKIYKNENNISTSSPLNHSNQITSNSGRGTRLNTKNGVTTSSSIGEEDYLAITAVPGLKGVEEIIDQRTNSKVFNAFVTIFENKIGVGEFPRSNEAAVAHDRALIRALGPINCQVQVLNSSIELYARDPLSSFDRFDSFLRRGLYGTSWDGVKDCDFSFLLTKPLTKSPPTKKKNNLFKKEIIQDPMGSESQSVSSVSKEG